jgi:hypothetical protein
MLLNDAMVRRLKAVGRLERAVKALRAKLAGLRAEQIDHSRWLKMPLTDKPKASLTTRSISSYG